MNECMFFGTNWGQNNFLSSTASTNVWMTSVTSMAKLNIILVGGFKDILLRIDDMKSNMNTHSDQKFPESEKYPLIMWKRHQNAHTMKWLISLSENYWSEWLSSFMRPTVNWFMLKEGNPFLMVILFPIFKFNTRLFFNYPHSLEN